MVDSPLFSIVTVTLNCAEDAVRTAQSVLAQDFSDYEYIGKDGVRPMAQWSACANWAFGCRLIPSGHL